MQEDSELLMQPVVLIDFGNRLPSTRIDCSFANAATFPMFFVLLFDSVITTDIVLAIKLSLLFIKFF